MMQLIGGEKMEACVNADCGHRNISYTMFLAGHSSHRTTQ